MTNTILNPEYVSKRKTRGAIAAGIGATAAAALLLTLLPSTGADTRASRSDAESTDGVVSRSLFDIAPIDSQSFDFNIDPGNSQARTILGANKGEGDANAHLAFAVTEFNIQDGDPALTDTMVTVRDVSPAGDIQPTEQRIDITLPLGEFKDTAFVSDRVISPGETLTLEVTMATPFDVNGADWSNDDGGWVQTPIQFTVFGADIEDNGSVSDLTRGQTFDEGAGAFLRPAADVRAAIDKPVIPRFVGGVDGASWTDQPVAGTDAAYADGARTVRSFLDPYGRSLSETVYLDENGALIGNGDADGNGNHYNATGQRQFG